MRILRVHAVPVRVPRARVSRSAFGVRDATEAGIVFVETDEGVTGFGEISLIWWRQGSGLCADVNRLLAPLLEGQDPARVAALMRRLREALPSSHDAPAIAAVEMALYDVLGRSLGVPVHLLLGGAVRDSIELSISLHMADPAVMASEAAEWAERGFRTMKVKMGRDWATDLKALAAVRDGAGDEVTLRIDVNEGWTSVPLAVRRLREVADIGVDLVEQPLPANDLEGLAELRSRSDVPVAVDESVWGPEDALRVVKARAADTINLYVSEAGGLQRARQVAELAETAGLTYWIGSMPELGLGTAAIAHLAAALPGLSLASDACGFIYHAADVLTEPLAVADGRIRVPTGPGLGVELDRAAVEHFRIKE
ncbi:mandelate racemase/muconate lactonizing enzyme family protein [Knoellia koreensis]|uniref:Dipeptide epimerase n=1 Tax=Knoellia koreensis TaxID=2730921 RepID=A0A849HMV5_9MICO|nr:enolase C-terminal domain-like protein [Knoellia sp. DB2414S]NNM47721.1 dipeptide epimerase [Knoellia sp. DB2414S]